MNESNWYRSESTVLTYLLDDVGARSDVVVRFTGIVGARHPETVQGKGGGHDGRSGG